MDDENPELEQRKRQFVDFFEDNGGDGQYGMVAKIRTIMDDGGRRVPINLDDLREYDPEMARDLVENPNVMMPALEQALLETAAHIGQNDGKKETEMKQLRPSFTGSFGNNLVSPRRKRGTSRLGSHHEQDH